MGVRRNEPIGRPPATTGTRAVHGAAQYFTGNATHGPEVLDWHGFNRETDRYALKARQACVAWSTRPGTRWFFLRIADASWRERRWRKRSGSELAAA